MRSPSPGWRRVPRLLATALLCGPVLLAGPASAAGAGSIDHVQSEGKQLQVLYSVPGLQPGQTPDLGTVTVTVNGTAIEARAELASEVSQDSGIERTAVLAMDVSKSMEGERFEQAKLAARAFLEGVSDDVEVGIVGFAGDVTTLQEPSLDRAASLQVLDDLELTLQTRLYDGVLEAVAATGSEGPRSVLVLSDGRDTSKTELDDVTATVEDSEVKIDVVALAQNEAGLTPLRAIAEAGEGRVLSADDPAALVDVFASEAESLAQQVLVTGALPDDFIATEGTLSVSLAAAGETYTDTAFVPLASSGEEAAPTATPRAAAGPTWEISRTVMIAALVGAALGALLLLLMGLGVVGAARPESVEERIAAYARGGDQRGGSSGPGHAAPSPGFKSTALGAAEKALSANKGFAATLATRLEGAGLSWKASEWLLMHAGVALGAGFLGVLLGGLPTMLLFLAGGAVVPWLYLARRQSKRIKAFNAQLADTLQLIAGGLSAGLSLAQSIDTVVRQGSEPMTTEFKRALTEARLGVALEDAMEAISARMQSQDFKWVVIAVRIQREVGGNLAEVLGQVAATIREREYLKRQVASLSAEGKMSAWILGALPVAIFAFLMTTNAQYFAPMFGNIIGWILMAVAVSLLTMGAFWMRTLIRMEV